MGGQLLYHITICETYLFSSTITLSCESITGATHTIPKLYTVYWIYVRDIFQFYINQLGIDENTSIVQFKIITNIKFVAQRQKSD